MGAGRGKSRRAQVPLASHLLPTFEREDDIGRLRLQSRDGASEDPNPRRGRGLGEIVLTQTISLPDTGFGSYQKEVKLETESMRQGETEVLLEQGVKVVSYGSKNKREFPIRSQFLVSLSEALAGSPPYCFNDTNRKQFVFVSAVGDDTYKDGKELILLVDDPDSAHGVQIRHQGKIPPLESYSDACKVILALDVPDALSLVDALNEEVRAEQAYEDLICKRMDRGKIGAIVVPEIRPVSF